MSKTRKKSAAPSQKHHKALSTVIAEKGITTSREFAECMSALMSDILCERVDPRIANAAINAGGKLLKIMEMQLKHGKVRDKRSDILKLVG